MTNVTHYSFLKSKTFYTLLFIFAFNGFAAVSGQLPSDITVPVNALFGILATYFHVSGVNASALATAQNGVISSGQN